MLKILSMAYFYLQIVDLNKEAKVDKIIVNFPWSILHRW